VAWAAGSDFEHAKTRPPTRRSEQAEMARESVIPPASQIPPRKGNVGLGDTDDRGSAPNQMGDNLPPVDL
jgi:hypothetical protein